MIALVAGWLAAFLGLVLGWLIQSPWFWIAVVVSLIGWRAYRARRPS